jgi:hypothetical protein
MLHARLSPDSFVDWPWRIHEFAGDFRVLDVWALPTPGGPDDFAKLIATFCSFDPSDSSPVVHALFAARWALGRIFGLDDPTDEIDSQTNTLAARLPEDLLDSFPADAPTGPFTPLYATRTEAALQIVNQTVHGLLHLGWAPDGEGGYRGEMTVLVKPHGRLGQSYLTAIAPFRHHVVYPAMLRRLEHRWNRNTSYV